LFSLLSSAYRLFDEIKIIYNVVGRSLSLRIDGVHAGFVSVNRAISNAPKIELAFLHGFAIEVGTAACPLMTWGGGMMECE